MENMIQVQSMIDRYIYDTLINPVKEQLDNLNIILKNNFIGNLSKTETEKFFEIVDSLINTRLKNYKTQIDSNYKFFEEIKEKLSNQNQKDQCTFLEKLLKELNDFIVNKLNIIKKEKIIDVKILKNYVQSCQKQLKKYEYEVIKLNDSINEQKNVNVNSEESKLKNIMDLLNDFETKEKAEKLKTDDDYSEIINFYESLRELLDNLNNMNDSLSIKGEIKNLSVVETIIHELKWDKNSIYQIENLMSPQEFKSLEDKLSASMKVIESLPNDLKGAMRNNPENLSFYLLGTRSKVKELIVEISKYISNVKKEINGDDIISTNNKQELSIDDNSQINTQNNSDDILEDGILNSAFLKDKSYNLESTNISELPIKSDHQIINNISDIMDYTGLNNVKKTIKPDNKQNIENNKNYHKNKRNYVVSMTEYNKIKIKHDQLKYIIDNKISKGQKLTLKEVFDECVLRQKLNGCRFSITDIISCIKFKYVSDKKINSMQQKPLKLFPSKEKNISFNYKKNYSL